MGRKSLASLASLSSAPPGSHLRLFLVIKPGYNSVFRGEGVMKRLRFAVVTFMVLLPASGAWAETGSSWIPGKVLRGNRERSAPQISPDGTRLGYLAPD